ncbi:MAG: FAD-dependent oxidoreductase, partial [Chloroflexi bacterium]
MLRVGIIGAGVAGLTAGYELTRAGHEAILFEAAPQVGGLAAGFRADHWDWHLEQFYHHLFQTDHTIRELVDEIGFSDRLFFRNPITAQWYNGRIFPLDGANPVEATLNVLRFPVMPFLDRIRYGAALAYLKYGTSNWHKLEQLTAAEWSRRWMGETAYRHGIEPLLEGKFGPFAREVNAAWLWARFRARTFQLGYFEGGFQAFVDALADRVRRQGGEILVSTPVQSITPLTEERLRVRAQGIDEAFDAVVSTVSPALLMRLAPDLPSDYLVSLRALNSLGAVVMVVA